MGYRSDLDAAHARAAALEKKLASGQEENEALRQKVERLENPPKKKEPKKKKPRKEKPPRGESSTRTLSTPITLIVVLVLTLLGAGFFTYRQFARFSDEMSARSEQNHACIESFVAAWAEQRLEDAWALTTPTYQQEVGKERFLREMSHHPFVRDLSGGTFTDSNQGVLHTRAGELEVVVGAYEGAVSQIYSEGFELLPPAEPALARGHAFTSALIGKRFEEAWKYTHPIYRKSMDAERFAQSLEQNIWLQAASGFRLTSVEGEDTSNVLRGSLITSEGSVGLVINYTEGGDAPYISEMSVGGKPSLPTP